MTYNLADKTDLYKFQVAVQNLISKEAEVELKEKTLTRTLRQNRAIHLYCSMVADELSGMGLMHVYTGLKGVELEIRYTQPLVKEIIWKPIQNALFGKESTTDLTTVEVGQVAEHIEMFFAKQGIDLPFPSIESLIPTPEEL